MDINDVAYEDRSAYQQFVYVVASRHASTGPWLHKKERRSDGTLVMMKIWTGLESSRI